MMLPVVLAAAATDAHAQDTETSSEYLIKAGFIYNFASLVQWPSASFSQADSPIVIAVLGEDHFGTTLDRVLQGVQRRVPEGGSFGGRSPRR